MKKIYFIFALILHLTFFAQINNFTKGFKKGYEDGFCYQKLNCLKPIPPIPPIPNLNESATNYKDGYNNGFLAGKSKSESNAISSSSSSQPSYSRNRNIDYWDDLEETQDQRLSRRAASPSSTEIRIRQLEKKIAEIDDEAVNADYNENYSLAETKYYALLSYLDELAKYFPNSRDLKRTRATKKFLYGQTLFSQEKYNAALGVYISLEKSSSWQYLSEEYSSSFLNQYAMVNKDLGNLRESQRIIKIGLAKFPQEDHWSTNLSVVEKKLQSEQKWESPKTEIVEEKEDLGAKYRALYREALDYKSYILAEEYNQKAMLYETYFSTFDRVEILFLLKRYKDCLEAVEKPLRWANEKNLRVKNELLYYQGMSKINLGNFYGGCKDINLSVSLGYQEAIAAQQKYCSKQK